HSGGAGGVRQGPCVVCLPRGLHPRGPGWCLSRRRHRRLSWRLRRRLSLRRRLWWAIRWLPLRLRRCVPRSIRLSLRRLYLRRLSLWRLSLRRLWRRILPRLVGAVRLGRSSPRYVHDARSPALARGGRLERFSFGCAAVPWPQAASLVGLTSEAACGHDRNTQTLTAINKKLTDSGTWDPSQRGGTNMSTRRFGGLVLVLAAL